MKASPPHINELHRLNHYLERLIRLELDESADITELLRISRLMAGALLRYQYALEHRDTNEEEADRRPLRQSPSTVKPAASKTLQVSAS